MGSKNMIKYLVCLLNRSDPCIGPNNNCRFSGGIGVHVNVNGVCIIRMITCNSGLGRI